MTAIQTHFEMPKSWTGCLQIRGCISDEDGVTEVEDADADFFGVYAQDANGLHMWVEDCDTKDQAYDIAKFLQTTI